ncbi:MAG: hypothetical protein M0D55_16450 [Elusimicrobiota bacterium]|nr:MAG: hypothetical protein M0D55_16450 [Elusimicrobiota bacterium]
MPRLPEGRDRAPRGDCLGCAHAKTLKTKSGSAIFLCGRAETEPAYEKYPALPLRGCPGRA